MLKETLQEVEVLTAVKSLIADIEKHQATMHELALKNVRRKDVTYFNNAILSLELIKDIVKRREVLTLGSNARG